MTQGWLALADGTVWPGRPFGALGRTTGEAVFNTAMTGYQEVLTDPSYRRQLVVMTAPHVGNTGVNPLDAESGRTWVAGFIVHRLSRRTSSWRATGSLEDWLLERGVPGLADVDTRSLILHLRERGAMPGALVTDGTDRRSAVEAARSAPDINSLDLVGEVTCSAPYTWTEPADATWYPAARPRPTADPRQLDLPVVPAATFEHHVVVLDCGVKANTLRLLAGRGCRVTVVPARTEAADILALSPDGVLLSNGPGDPGQLPEIVAQVRRLLGKVPLFGICLGHQLLGLSLGGRTYKLKFGHRGVNQPVRGPDGRVGITSHNHGFALAPDGLDDRAVVSHVNLNDQCVEGLRVPAAGAFSVQYHPEAGPGTHDALHLFDEFLAGMAAWRSGGRG